MAAFLRVCFFYFIASAASQERDDTDRRLLAARCYAHCLTYDPLATNKQVWAPYSLDRASQLCSVACTLLLTSNAFNASDCLSNKNCNGLACKESCYFVEGLLKEPVGASISNTNPNLPALPSPPVVDVSSGKVEVQWEAPDPVYPAPGVNHGVGFGSLFVIQYAEVDCGQSTDSLVWIQAQFPEEALSLKIDDNDSPKFDLGHIYVFRVATVNANGTAGFSQSKAAYGLNKQCVTSHNQSAILSEDLRVLAFLLKEVEIYWKDPLPKSSCFYACVRKTAEQLDESKCQEGALFEYVNTTAKTFVTHQAPVETSSNCSYEARVSFLPLNISTNGMFQYQARKSVVWTDVNYNGDDVRFATPEVDLSQTKTYGYRINVTAIWSLPVYYSPILAYYQVQFGKGKSSVSFAGEVSILLKQDKIYLSEAIDGKFMRVYANLMPETFYWVKVLAVTDEGGGKSSKANFIKTEEFPVPRVPTDILISMVSLNSSFFNALVIWNNSEPESELDYPLMASYVHWGTGKKFEQEAVIGISRVNATLEEYKIAGLIQESSGSVVDYWLQVWSSSAKGNSTKSRPSKFKFSETGTSPGNGQTDFSVPGVPVDVRVNAVPTNSSIFNALVTWKNSEPQDYPLLASYVQWGIGKSYEPTSVIGISRVNGAAVEYEITDLQKENGGSPVVYWLWVWSGNARGNSSESDLYEFNFRSVAKPSGNGQIGTWVSCYFSITISLVSLSVYLLSVL